MIVSSNATGGNLIFLFFKTISVNIVQKCQSCVENEKPVWEHLLVFKRKKMLPSQMNHTQVLVFKFMPGQVMLPFRYNAIILSSRASIVPTEHIFTIFSLKMPFKSCCEESILEIDYPLTCYFFYIPGWTF